MFCVDSLIVMNGCIASKGITAERKQNKPAGQPAAKS